MDQIFGAGTASGTDPTAAFASEDDWQAALDHAAGVREQEEAEPATTGADDASLFASNRVGQVVLPVSVTTSVSKILAEAHGPAIRTTAMRFYLATTTKASQPGTVVSDFGGGSLKRSYIPMPAGKDFTGLEADAFLAGFMPQIFATSYTVLKELKKRLGEAWQPQRVLDAGVGPGIGALAYHQVFGVEQVEVVDGTTEQAEKSAKMHIVVANQGMRDRADTIWKTQAGARHELFWKMPGTRAQHYDLVVAPHSLLDVKGPNSQRDAFVKDLWSRVADGGVLLLLERGTPLGFEAVARAREILLRKQSTSIASEEAADLRAAGIEDASEAKTSDEPACHVIAPCPHDGVCPLWMFGHQPSRQQWCHFSQRLQRPQFLQRTKHAKSNTEDCTYAYVMFRKGLPRPALPASRLTADPSGEQEVPDPSEMLSHERIVSSSYHWPRIILPPLKKHKHILLDVCSGLTASEEGKTKLERMTIPKSQGTEQYRFARRSHWGDLLPFRGKTVVERPVVDRQGKRKKYSRRQHLESSSA